MDQTLKVKAFDKYILKQVLSKCYCINSFQWDILDAFENLNLYVVSSDDGLLREFVVKVSEFCDGKREVAAGLEFQFELMQFLSERGITTTRPVPSVTRQLTYEHIIDAGESDKPTKLCIYMLHFVPGITLRKAGNPLSLMRDVGRLAGKVDAALQKFVPSQKPEPSQAKSWVIPDVSQLESRLEEYCDRDVVAMGSDILQLYRESVLPLLSTFRKGYIHGDLHDCNIIVAPTKSTVGEEEEGYSVSGVIYFEDVVEYYYVFELAIVIADLMSACCGRAEPLHVARPILAGYRQDMELSQAELSALRLCICVRLLHYYILSGDSVNNDPDNTYVGLDRDNYLEVFKKMYSISDREFTAKVIDR